MMSPKKNRNSATVAATKIAHELEIAVLTAFAM
jgi:hypothetical protein